MELSEAGKKAIIDREGFKKDAYLDSVGIKTIGVGHILRPGESEHVDYDQVLRWFDQDCEPKIAAVNQMIKNKTTTQNQFDALVSFAFNLGEAALAHSTLLRKFLAGDTAGAAVEFVKWDYAGGRESDGLKRRRVSEQQQFLTQ